MKSLQPGAEALEPQKYLAAGQEMRELTQSLPLLRRGKGDSISRAIGNLHAAANALDLLGGRPGAEEREKTRIRTRRGDDFFDEYSAGWSL